MSNVLYIYRGERVSEEKKHNVGWKESGKQRGRLYAGKNLKNHWRAQRKWGRKKKERQAKSRGGTSERGEVKKCTRKRSRGKRKNNGYCMRETGEGNKTNACLGERGKGGWRTERKMKTWQSAQPVVSGSSRKLHREKSCLLRLMGKRIWETHFPADPHPAQITTPCTPVPL